MTLQVIVQLYTARVQACVGPNCLEQLYIFSHWEQTSNSDYMIGHHNANLMIISANHIPDDHSIHDSHDVKV